MTGPSVPRSPALLACSTLAFHAPYWEVAQALHRDHGIGVRVLGPERVAVPTAYHPSGWLDARPSEDGVESVPLPLREPANPWQGFRAGVLAAHLPRVTPPAVWLQEEPPSGVVQQFLTAHVWGRRGRARIGCSIVENLWTEPTRLTGLLYRARISRIDHFFACTEGAWQAFQAAYRVRGRSYEVAYFPTSDCAVPRRPPRKGFVLGFAGRLCGEKGWRVLLEALSSLPPEVTLRVAGGGPDEEAVRATVHRSGLAARVVLEGVVTRQDLPEFYAGLDLLVLPSQTTPRWKEQFGAVLAEAMSAHVPVIGSSSGAIPEVVGNAGVLVPEGDVAALREAIEALRAAPARREALARAGRHRFEEKFSTRAFARRVAGLCAPSTPVARVAMTGCKPEDRDAR